MKKQSVWQFIKFALFSASAGIIETVSMVLLYETAKLEYWVAYPISLSLSVIWNFTFNRRYTFKSAANVPVAMAKVFGFYLVFTPLSTWWTAALTTLGWNEYLIEAINMLANEGIEPPIWKSGNCPGGDEWNNRFIDRFKGYIRCL